MLVRSLSQSDESASSKIFSARFCDSDFISASFNSSDSLLQWDVEETQ
jgi:hypothetical protein